MQRYYHHRFPSLSEDGGGTEDVVVSGPAVRKIFFASSVTRWHKVNVLSVADKSSSKPFTTFGHPNCALKIVDATGPKTALMSILTDEFAKRFSSTTVSTSDGFDE